eukprot:Selendium_serpulae@DN6651_c0_g1_i1.p1
MKRYMSPLNGNKGEKADGEKRKTTRKVRKFFSTSSGCRNGDKCDFYDGMCAQYERNGSCTYGDKCKYKHKENNDQKRRKKDDQDRKVMFTGTDRLRRLATRKAADIRTPPAVQSATVAESSGGLMSATYRATSLSLVVLKALFMVFQPVAYPARRDED